MLHTEPLSSRPSLPAHIPASLSDGRTLIGPLVLSAGGDGCDGSADSLQAGRLHLSASVQEVQVIALEMRVC